MFFYQGTTTHEEYRTYFKTSNQVQDQGGMRWSTTVIVGYFEDWPPYSNTEIGPEGRF